MDRNRSLGDFVDVSSCQAATSSVLEFLIYLFIYDNDIDIIFDAMLHGEPIEAP